ncbi:pilus assembly protein TadG-related protein [Candidatus Margulisiibacteriota bacterium]
MKKDNRRRNKKKQNHGQIMVMVALFFTTIILVGGLVTDVGTMMLVRQRIKRAADAAALAGAQGLPSGAVSEANALNYAALNGFTNGSNGVTVVTDINPTGENENWVRVTITAPHNFFFGRLIGLTQRNITMFATAQFNTFIPISINLAGIYGEEKPEVTLMVRGKQSPFEHGDPYSVPILDDGSPNPLYDPDGYNYRLYVPEDYVALNGSSIMKVEIYDPDSWGNFDSEGTRTLTHYKLYAPDSTPQDYSDDVLIATYSKSGVADTSVTWANPPGFMVDIAVWGNGIYRVNVNSDDGYNANGFHLRAGPDEKNFNPNNGTRITTDGRLPLRFNKTGDIVMELGYVPASAAGTRLHINKFDTDIGSTDIIYSCSTVSQTWGGELAGNAEWKEDVIDVPSAYAGGIWYAQYYAGNTDCSVWSMWYEGMSTEENGFVSLVE